MTSLVVDGSSPGCRTAARELRRLEARTAAVAEHLASVRTTSGGSWRGAAGESFRAQVRSALVLADDQVARLRLVGPALRVLASRLDGVQAMMDEARRTARAGGVPVAGDALPHAADVRPEQGEALARATAIVARARDREAQAQADWLAVLDDAFPPLEVSRLDHPVPAMVRDNVRTWPDLTGADRALDFELPVALPLLPPALRRPFVGYTDVLRPAITATTGQIEDDLERDDLSLLERVGRGSLVGATTAVGAVGAIALCARISATRRSAPVCGKVGAWVGTKAGRKALEVADAH
ncbi:hypothetical protein EKO23_08220 [Nocardioides guangzhouensis]|uniref:Uncharacterized protein n=1 Tax=Nocardioides guangzhouensis TaxID=2497878 RepID=A0A4Q4ZGQ7_9ACTN|nr:hypothetical protein [Nocardioides guangzhouensis]RYP86651.1 hypothetical protein EKO23_08220 [Nocardioides guangzhouensis]